MGFLYLLVVVVAITATALIAKLASRKGITPLDLAASMFAISTALGAVFLFRHLPRFTTQAVFLSAIAGAGGGLAVLAFNAAIRAGHFGFSNAIYRCSFLVPVVYAVLFLSATLKVTTIAGITLILAGILLMSHSTASFEKGKTAEFRWFALIMLAFLLSGAPRVGQTLASLYQVDYLLYLFLSYLAGTLTLIPWALIRRSFSPASVPWGGGAAVSSFAGVFCTLKALESLKPQVVFPISLSGPIVLGVLFSLLLFREKIKPAGWSGVALAITGITVLAIWK